jgi:hypothetical protein
MNIKNKENILLGLVIVSIVIVMIFSYFKIHADVVVMIYLISLTLLLGNYLFAATSVFHKVLLLGFFVGLMGHLFVLLHWPYGHLLVMGSAVSQVIFGLTILYKGVKEVFSEKGFELFIWLLGGLLLITGVILVLPMFFAIFYKEELVIENGEWLAVPLLGVIGTIMANENIWDDFIPDQKKILTYILLITIIPVAGTIFEKYLR